MEKIIIAIDGYAACGKSTIAKDLAESLNYIFIDSGAMYRAVTLYFLKNAINIEDKKLVVQALKEVIIKFKRVDGQNHTYLNGEDVEQLIRSIEVNNWVSQVAAISSVRRALVAQQQEMGKEKGIVMDGRDIGTVVFPQAELKLFVTADLEVRAQRRYLELTQKGVSTNLAEIKHNLLERDRIDTTRADSPLTKAIDAILLDTSHLTRRTQLEKALKYASALI